MSEISRDINTSGETKIGPDLFQYYVHVVAELLSGDDFSPSSVSSQLVGAGNGSFGGKEESVCHEKYRPVGFGSLFCNAVGDGLSGYEKSRLTTMLRQSVVALTQEVDEMLHPVFSMHQLRRLLIPTQSFAREQDANCKAETENRAHKRLKTSLSSGPVSCNLTEEVNDDLQVLLVNRGPKVVEKMEKHTAELSATLGCMEEKLEKLLDSVISSCRAMTLAEKHQLRKLIQKLPPKNLARVVEILHRGKPSEKRSGDDISVDLQHEDNLTLWRIYFYVKAVENAQKLLV